MTGTCTPFHLHNEVAYQIKLSLTSSTRKDPDVRIEVPFDRFLFIGGLQQVGEKLGKCQGQDLYGISRYSDLDPILGPRWHIRVLNKQMDFCFAQRDTVRFHLHHRRPIIEHEPAGTTYVDGGYVLVFRFVRGDGIRRQYETFITNQ